MDESLLARADAWLDTLAAAGVRTGTVRVTRRHWTRQDENGREH